MLARSDVGLLEDAVPQRAPWEAEPHRLWSLLDMVRFYNATFIAAWGAFTRVVGGIGDPDVDGLTSRMRASLAELKDEIKKANLPISYGTQEQIRLLELYLAPHTPDFGFDPQTSMAVLSVSLSNCLMGDLASHLFLRVSPDRKFLYLQDEPTFGPTVDARFEGARDDIAAAARCLALDEWTAVVFHCMRVLEHGLEPMAVRLQVTFDKASWHAILRDIETGLQGLRNKPHKTAQEDMDVTNYSEAAVQFRHFKDAWRNHAAHGRDNYGEPAARTVFDSVRSFMQKMAEIV